MRHQYSEWDSKIHYSKNYSRINILVLKTIGLNINSSQLNAFSKPQSFIINETSLFYRGKIFIKNKTTYVYYIFFTKLYLINKINSYFCFATYVSGNFKLGTKIFFCLFDLEGSSWLSLDKNGSGSPNSNLYIFT